MLKGGYKIIDLRDTEITAGGDAVKISGVHEAVEASYHKPLMLSGLNVGGVEYGAAYAVPTTNSGNYVFAVHGYNVTINSDDTVTVTTA